MSAIDLTEARRAGAAYLVTQGLNRSGPDMSARIVDLAAPLIEAAIREKVAAEIRATAADPERTRPARKDAEVATDFANDFEWAAMIAENGATS